MEPHERRVIRMLEKMIEPKLCEKPPLVCPKANCGGTFFIPHEDGWQCFNCMKIIYKAKRSATNPNILKRQRRKKSEN
jgi:ribosomal protein S27AE